ncbi:OsmC family protein [Streptomyces sp. NPDC102437]
MSSDEPTALLGTDTAVSPGEYLLQALGLNAEPGCCGLNSRRVSAGLGDL